MPFRDDCSWMDRRIITKAFLVRIGWSVGFGRLSDVSKNLHIMDRDAN